MKLTITLIIALFFCNQNFAQQLDQNITNIATDIAQKAVKKGKTRLALTDFVNSDGKVDALTSYIRQELELKLINADNLQVMDRKHIKLLLSDNKLESDGLIDETVAKSSTAFIKVDGWVVAEITYLGDQVKIKVTVTDVVTSLMYAASTSELISDVAIKNLLDPEEKICSQCGGRGTIQMQSLCTVCDGTGNIVCKSCNGAGKKSSWTVGSYEVCDACRGSGKSLCNVCSGNGKIISYRTCPKCGGKVQMKATDGKGATQTSTQRKIEVCPVCLGSGKIKSEVSCSSCGGSGKAPFGPASNWENKACSSCRGKGTKISVTVCSRCNGTGQL